MTKIWIATYVDYSDTSDGKAGVLGTYLLKEDAQAEVRADMEKWCDDRAGMPIVVDFNKMSAKYDWKTLDNTDGCEWNITEDEIDI